MVRDPTVDLVKRGFTATWPDRLRVTDLTLLPTGEGQLWRCAERA